ncbi:winged helix-turn-helix domain-containing protein [Miltoncostaea marina]|uniref:winged helix-turn-helix domain-containing protein n=1 Tax=Miltoncostaea marina TaxID=2843215 RepID=UPI001C3E6127|nr:winged helix-turn-helix domain-containing protein [Miltoncostaea marina]
MATTSPSERPPLALAPEPASDEPPPIDEAQADRLYADTMAAARRAARVAAELERAARAGHPAWQAAATSARRAEASLRTAAQVVPDVPPDAPADPRRATVLGDLTIDRARRAAFWTDTPLALTRLEFDLLVALAERPGEVLTKDDLLRRVWGYAGRARTRTVDSHASRLRRSLHAAGAPGATVVNVWGIGYRLTVTDDPEAA